MPGFARHFLPIAFAVFLTNPLSAGPAVSAESPPPLCNCSVTLSPTPPAEERGTEKAPLRVQVTQMPSKTPDEAERDKADRIERVSTDRWTIGIAALTGVVLLLQLFVFGRQASRLRESIDEARHATRATQTAAKAAEQTVITMNLTARRDLRAYVAIANSSISGLDDRGLPHAEILIRNFGKTPAYAFAVRAEMQLVVRGVELLPPAEPTHVIGHLAPGADYTVLLDATTRLPTHARDQLISKDAAFHVYGIIRYIDSYGQRHFTRFRIVTDGRTSVPTGRLASFDTGNDTDDDAEILAAAARQANVAQQG